MTDIDLSGFNKEIEKNWILPELERRGTSFSDKIWFVLVLMKEGLNPPKVLFNNEAVGVHLNIANGVKNDKIIINENFSIDNLVNGFIQPDTIIDIQIPQNFKDEFIFVSAFIFNNRWYMSFDTAYNRRDARFRINKAKEFLKLAQDTSNQHLDIKSYQLFQALEQALWAKYFLVAHNKQRIEENKKHALIKEMMNKDAKMGNILPVFKDLYNKLSDNRDGIYKTKEITISEHDLLVAKLFIESWDKRINS